LRTDWNFFSLSRIGPKSAFTIACGFGGAGYVDTFLLDTAWIGTSILPHKKKGISARLAEFFSWIGAISRGERAQVRWGIESDLTRHSARGDIVLPQRSAAIQARHLLEIQEPLSFLPFLWLPGLSRVRIPHIKEFCVD
jgi:hypothetical protein